MLRWDNQASDDRFTGTWHSFNQSKRWIIHDNRILWDSLWELPNIFNEKTTPIGTRNSGVIKPNKITIITKRNSRIEIIGIKKKEISVIEGNKIKENDLR
jgi:hypothetical protein